MVERAGIQVGVAGVRGKFPDLHLLGIGIDPHDCVLTAIGQPRPSVGPLDNPVRRGFRPELLLPTLAGGRIQDAEGTIPLGGIPHLTVAVIDSTGVKRPTLERMNVLTSESREIGFVFQMAALLPRNNAAENVMLPLAYAGVEGPERRRRAIAALDRVGLSHRLDHSPRQLSGGEQQRVAIARALVNNPLLILADEPTGALDSKTSDTVLSLFEDLHQEGRTIIIVTHSPEVSERVERRVSIFDGQIIEDRQLIVNPRRAHLARHAP